MKHFTTDIVISLENNKAGEENFNMIIDESGGIDVVSKPKNRAIGALIFFDSIENLNTKFEEFVNNSIILSKIINQKPHQIKYEKIKRYASVHNIEKDEIFCLILDFLVKNDCKFYWYNVKSSSKNIKEENEEEIYGRKFTKIILDYNMHIIPNIILCKKRDKKIINSIKIYCDKDIYEFDKLHVYIKGFGFIVYPYNYDEAYDEHYEFDIYKISSNNLLHQCCDIICGIARENIGKLGISKSYKILLDNRFADIVNTLYT